MASERQDRLRALVLAACEDLGRYGLEPTPEAVAAVASLVVNASRLGAEVDAAAEIARLRAIIEADGLDPDAPMPPGLTVVNERLRRKLKEAWRERSAARAEALTAQASLRRVERELEEARERERGYREALERVVDGGCERFAGTDCWQMGMDPNAKDYADRVCDPCFARRALATPEEPSGV